MRVDVDKILGQHIADAVDEVREAVIEEARHEFTVRLRERLARSAVAIHDEYSVERMGNILRIEVKVK